MVQGRIGPERQSLSKVWNNRHAAFRLSGLKKGDYILQRTRILAPEASTVSRRSRIRLGLYYKIPRRRISGVKTGNRELESRYGKVYNRAKKCDQKNENMIKRRVSASLFIPSLFSPSVIRRPHPFTGRSYLRHEILGTRESLRSRPSFYSGNSITTAHSTLCYHYILITGKDWASLPSFRSELLLELFSNRTEYAPNRCPHLPG